jgi:hypothetical protein
MSIFSGLNNLDDISLDRRYGSICGYTQEELDAVFGKLLAGVDMEKVRQWYNGYNFEGEDVYNPYDILLFISKEYRYRNYWFSTGTPSFLIKLLKEKNYFVPALEHLMVDDSVLDSFEIEDIRLEPLLFQSGYLTIGEVRESKRGGIEYSLRIPNKEVQISFNDILLDYFISDVGIKKRNQDVLYDAFDQGDMELLRSNLRSLYGGIPYNYFIKNEMDKYEGYYASVFYAYIASLGMRIIPEDVTSRGRIDFTVEFGKRFYIFEFKVKEESPLKQIKEKRYYEKYLGRGKEVFIIGIVFDEGIRNIKEFEWEKMC